MNEDVDSVLSLGPGIKHSVHTKERREKIKKKRRERERTEHYITLYCVPVKIRKEFHRNFK